MSQHFSRREFLVSSLGAAGVLAAGGPGTMCIVGGRDYRKGLLPCGQASGHDPHGPGCHPALPQLRTGRAPRETRCGPGPRSAG